ncbi:bifunctional [glutamine synthetase] adenylyltransferase/[glutamine synthetase]-adenylyl-L-tyrosine phosphorylase [Limoniibacter endophyticus]|uniref:Bifunctional glutamine synthetase adenylyltransferase/adenylyl-removing enzyme n=1 Tax=Limoniibacter endophyticus TaxID=1565040 RepID=A0A8J3DN09_9HYPH|nr:bifunctional [glutamine synthetase] adenylyltransferase/[glutamine synthetase]-adenylyl-L-tyrosine phosphorylase [Limoniibacter endophyticus]GHC69226.1 glutamate-ammonia-ligase adenylyltransferase [Limoniibacter endophyticus]
MAETIAELKLAVRSLHPLDAEHARKFRKELGEDIEGSAAALAHLLKAEGEQVRFIEALFDLSPFMRDSVRRRPQTLEALFDLSVEERLAQLRAELERVGFAETEKDVMRLLRQLKAQAHFLIALDDIANNVEPQVTVERLSDLASACVNATVNFLLREAHGRGKIALPDESQPGRGSGWIVLAMGKLGARELNFSSDIDLISFLDPDAPAILDRMEAGDLFSKLTQRMMRILQDRTEHGYVFRTDLRLRPDPGSTPLCIPVGAALVYYESRGQNWERAAMIKACAIAGDIKAGEAFLRELQPYVWRKYLDYAAIADVHSIKRQIHAHKGHGAVAVKGHNVKLGRGGIREIEFFVQTQQLIAGGRVPELRGKKTVEVLAELEKRKWIDADTRDEMTAAYWFLRKVENAIQMVNDEQTHLMPTDDEGVERIARLVGETDFVSRFTTILQTVEKHYAELFETAPSLSSGIGNLVFTGDEDDPDTLNTLASLGFKRPSDIARIIRVWHFGRYRSTRSAEARERLTELTPALLKAFGETRRADEAVLRLDSLLQGLPAGIQLFSLLHSNPGLLQLLATIMGSAPRLADIVTKRPHVFDGLLDPAILSELPDRDYLASRLEAFLGNAPIYEERLNRLRIFAAEQKFLIGIRLLTGTIDGARAGAAFSDLADLTIGTALEAVIEEMETRHGRVRGSAIALLCMGKLGSRELSAGSDVDLILLYDHDPEADESDGEKPLASSQYFARLTQRLIAAVSAPTAEGVLYEIDLRLRPSGNKGPVATHIDSFRRYQASEAWTWEHMALTRARAIAGDLEFCAKVEADVRKIVSAKHDAAKVRADAAEMRALLEEEKPAKNRWDLKLAKGGLIDLEFIAQVARLTAKVPAATETTSTVEILSQLQGGAATPQMADELAAAHRLYTGISQMIALCLTGPLDPDDIPPGLADRLLAVGDAPDMAVLEAQIDEAMTMVRDGFEKLVGAVLRP